MMRDKKEGEGKRIPARPLDSYSALRHTFPCPTILHLHVVLHHSYVSTQVRIAHRGV